MQSVMTIGGRSVSGSATMKVINPATGVAFTEVPVCTPALLDEAVAAAQAALARWSEDEPARRRALATAADLLERRLDEVFPLLSAEQGKSLAMARMETHGAAANLRAHASIDLPSETIRDDGDARKDAIARPVGVVAAITAWNYPVALAANKLAPALVAGNTVVLKPSPLTPVSTLKLVEILSEAFPPGVVNVVSGGDDLGAQLTTHADVRMVSFTGSIATGKRIAEAVAGDLKRLLLELGGNDAAVLLDDFDIDTMAEPLLWSAMRNCGQVCAAVKRVYAPAERYQEIVDALARGALAIRVGAGDEEGVEMGPLQNEAQLHRVEHLVDDAVRRGARCVAGGERLDRPGYFYAPTVLAEAEAGMPIVDDEQFGPALPVIAYHGVEEAIDAANATRFGLGGSVWGLDEDRATQLGARLRCGTTWINTHAVPFDDAPFGGRDWSGIGVENGRWGLEQYIDWQTVYTPRSRPARDSAAMAVAAA